MFIHESINSIYILLSMYHIPATGLQLQAFNIQNIDNFILCRAPYITQNTQGKKSKHLTTVTYTQFVKTTVSKTCLALETPSFTIWLNSNSLKTTLLLLVLKTQSNQILLKFLPKSYSVRQNYRLIPHYAFFKE